MVLIFKHRYENLSDKEIVDLIITEPFDEDAATYLIYDRYEPLCKSICFRTLNNMSRLDELQSELFMLLKGQKQDWQVLKSFQWRSSLSTWLNITAYNLSLDLRKKIIENEGENTSLDDDWNNDESKRLTVDVPINEEKQLERHYNMLVLNEIIQQLKNPDQRFVVIKRLQGFSSKEVASMLERHWSQNNIVRYNRISQVIIPDSGYIDNLFKRGYDRVKKIFKSYDK